MKHAILIISSLGEDYLINCINQFKNDDDIYFFIHTDLYETNYTNDHILYIGHKFHCKRFSRELADVMMFLINKVKECPMHFDYIHFFSDTCRLIVSVQTFKQFFINHNGYSFVQYGSRTDKYSNMNYYKGSQWISLHSSTYNQLTQKMYDDYMSKRRIVDSYDETVLQSIIIQQLKHENVWNKNLRYINYEILIDTGHAPTLNPQMIHNLSNDDILDIHNNCLIARKLDFKQPNYEETLQLLYNIKKGVT